MAIAPEFLTTFGSRLRAFVTFDATVAEDRETPAQTPVERDNQLLADKQPAKAAELEQVSEYRLASLMQFPFH